MKWDDTRFWGGCLAVLVAVFFFARYLTNLQANHEIAAERRGHGTGWNDYNAFFTQKLNDHISMRADKGDEAGRKALAVLRDDVKRTISGQ